MQCTPDANSSKNSSCQPCDEYFDNKIYQRQVKKPQEKARKIIIALANQMIDEQFPLEEDNDAERGTSSS